MYTFDFPGLQTATQEGSQNTIPNRDQHTRTLQWILSALSKRNNISDLYYLICRISTLMILPKRQVINHWSGIVSEELSIAIPSYKILFHMEMKSNLKDSTDRKAQLKNRTSGIQGSLSSTTTMCTLIRGILQTIIKTKRIGMRLNDQCAWK